MAHTQLSRTPSGAGNRKTFTISVWVKRSELGTENLLLKIDGGTSNTNYIEMKFDSSDRLLMGGYTSNFLRTNRLFRDPSAWYHIVWRVDTTQSTADDRVRLYVNGVQETSFGQRNNPGQNDDMAVNSTTSHILGSTLDGYLAQYIIADGQSLAPTTVGSTNADGVWIPNVSPSVTYGTNGFKLDFTGTGASADSSGFGADSSGNNNHFASSNLGTNPNTKDGPANNFSTMNPVAGTGISISNGALTFSGNFNSVSSFGVYDGKWYCEMKITNTNTYNPMIGIAQGYTDMAQRNINNYPGQVTDSYGINREGNLYVNGSNSGSQGFTLAQNDIVGVALDLASGTKNIKFYKNGSQVVSQNLSETLNDPYVFVTYASSSQAGTGEWNFGNPPFTIASSNSDANGYGSFEYAVPSGYYALCSKNLGQYG
jgi:hypothetical protein